LVGKWLVMEELAGKAGALEREKGLDNKIREQGIGKRPGRRGRIVVELLTARSSRYGCDERGTVLAIELSGTPASVDRFVGQGGGLARPIPIKLAGGAADNRTKRKDA
jgi:hypothetical protein